MQPIGKNRKLKLLSTYDRSE